MEKQSLEISWASLWRIAIFLAFATVIYLGHQIVLGLFLAIVISSGFEGIVDNIERRLHLPRSLGVVLLFLVATLAIVLFLYAAVPFAIVELNTIALSLGKSTPAATGSLGFLLSLRTSQSASSFIQKLSSQIFSGSSSLGLFSSAFSSLGLIVSVIASSFYLSLSRDGVERFIRMVVPAAYEPATLRIYERSRRKIGAWFRMQLVLSLIMGLIVWGGLTLLGVQGAFLIGCLAAVFELVPFIGPIVSGAFAVVSAIGTSAQLAVYTLIFFVVAQQFESNVLVPLFSKRSVDLHPVIVITALLIGAEVGGFLGIVIAVPLAAVFQEVAEEWSIKKRGIPIPE
ncbi:MAG: AI-2E family transporter [Minisyncoccia bacterium]|jgi:predicted PurR-regulated permease PerM